MTHSDFSGLSDFSSSLHSSADAARLSPRGMLTAMLPLLLGTTASGLAGWHVTSIAHWLFGGTPQGFQGYLLLALVLLPLLLSLVATELRIAHWHEPR